MALVIVGLVAWEHVRHTRTELEYLSEQMKEVRALAEKIDHSTSQSTRNAEEQAQLAKEFAAGTPVDLKLVPHKGH